LYFVPYPNKGKMDLGLNLIDCNAGEEQKGKHCDQEE